MIKVKNLRKVYKVGGEKVVALNNISLHIEKGEFCCIVGTSGSGKSTLLNMLAGLEKPTKGAVKIAGQKISAMSEKQLAVFRQNNIGFIFQSYNLMPTLTAVENVAFPLMFQGIGKASREKKARAILKEMGLAARMEHKPGELSGGQQQRVGIARAFVGRPKVIFADEPTGNLDSATTEQVMEMLLEISRRNNITFVMVTHDPELAKRAKRIITLKDGSVISDTRDGVSLLEEDLNVVIDEDDAQDQEVGTEDEDDEITPAEIKDVTSETYNTEQETDAMLKNLSKQIKSTQETACETVQ
ncbi:MAG: ABC transporter ATP-binding protein [Oscillospiraceae bacterium]